MKMWSFINPLVLLLSLLQCCRGAGYGHHSWETHLYDSSSFSPFLTWDHAEHQHSYSGSSFNNNDYHTFGQPEVPSQWEEGAQFQSQGYPYHQPDEAFYGQRHEAFAYPPMSAHGIEPTSYAFTSSHTNPPGYHDGTQYHSTVDPYELDYEQQSRPLAPGETLLRAQNRRGRDASTHTGTTQKLNRRPKVGLVVAAAADDDEEGDNGEDTDHHKGSSSSGDDKVVVKAQVDHLWERKGLWIGMSPRELAASIAEMRLEIGIEKSRSIGLIISHRTRNHKLATSGYKKELKKWLTRFTTRLTRLEHIYTRKTSTVPVDEVMIKAYINIRNMRDRQEYVLKFDDEIASEKRADSEARRVWDAFIHNCVDSEYRDRTSPESIPTESIEILSRPLRNHVPGYTMEEIADRLRRYMMTMLHRQPEEIDVFNKARNEWLQELHFLEHLTM